MLLLFFIYHSPPLATSEQTHFSTPFIQTRNHNKQHAKVSPGKVVILNLTMRRSLIEA